MGVVGEGGGRTKMWRGEVRVGGRIGDGGHAVPSGVPSVPRSHRTA